MHTNLIYCKSFLLIGIALLLSSWTLAQGIVVKPYLQQATPNSMTIMWEVDSIGVGEVHWGNTPFALDNITASSNQVGSGDSRIHTALISSLSAQQKYYYKIEMEDGTTSSLYHFRTAPEKNSEQAVQLVAISDMQRDGSQPDKFREIVDEGIIATMTSELGSDLSELEAILIPGDLVVTGGNYSQWENHFFQPGDSLFPHVPLYPVPGNHEYHSGGLPNFIKYFDLPQNGEASLLEECWYTDLSNIRIIGLNSNAGTADKTAQLAWLETVLSSACSDLDIDFVFAELHHPHKSELWTPGESSFTGEVIEKLENFTESCGKASIHFFGHTHGYSRGQSRDYEHLWINVATAGGAIDNWGEFPNADYEEFTKSQDEYGFLLVEVEAGSEPQVKLKRYSRGDQSTTLNNVLRDELTIKKVEFPPATPINIYPTNDTIQAGCLNLKGSEYFGIEDEHQASHWQVALGGDFIDSLVAEEWLQSENWYFEVNLQENDDLTDVEIENLLEDKEYHWRVRYRDEYLKWSPWSTATTFFLKSNAGAITANLILNNGAEDGITNWTGDIESLENGECNSVQPYQGTHNFGVGGVCANESNVGIATQDIDLSGNSAQINTGNISAEYSAYMRNFSGSDIPEYYVAFYNQTNLLATSPIISNTTATWTLKSNTFEIPIGTDNCQVILKGTRNAGSDNDSYFDEISLRLVVSGNCGDCLGDSNIDLDNDGFCDDEDCNDNNAAIYPGALEICDQLDNDCDGKADSGNVVTWTGAAGNLLWSDPDNWDQFITPLRCQHVIIATGDTISVDGNQACKTIEIAAGNQLQISPNSLLTINGEGDNLIPAMVIHGSLLNNGKCVIHNSQNQGIDVFGSLINNGIISTEGIMDEVLIIRNGAIVENSGAFNGRG